jgi:hypothetical protein
VATNLADSGWGSCDSRLGRLKSARCIMFLQRLGWVGRAGCTFRSRCYTIAWPPRCDTYFELHTSAHLPCFCADGQWNKKEKLSYTRQSAVCSHIKLCTMYFLLLLLVFRYCLSQTFCTKDTAIIDKGKRSTFVKLKDFLGCRSWRSRCYSQNLEEKREFLLLIQTNISLLY